MTRIAIVTGGNKGIGFAICKGLSQEGIKVILTARDKEKGEQAVSRLHREGFSEVIFHQLDVTKENSVQRLANFVDKEFGKLDILVNNAGIFIDKDMTMSNVDFETVRKTLETNTLGPLRMCQALIPCLRKSDDPRIVNLSSGLGELGDASSGFPSYSLSKTALNSITVKLAAEFPDIKVNSMCPGWVRTDMGGQNASKSPEEGADTAVFLSTAKKVPSGKFFRERKVIDW